MAENYTHPPVSETIDEQLLRLNERQAYIATALNSWYIGGDRDSLTAQRARASLFYELDGELVELAKESAIRLDGYDLKLITGDEPIRTTTFRKGAYDMYSEQHSEVEPGTEITIKQARHWAIAPYSLELPEPSEFYNRRMLFVGDFRHQVPLTYLAKTLHEGGVFRLTDSETGLVWSKLALPS